jgi:hypothetical protein
MKTSHARHWATIVTAVLTCLATACTTLSPVVADSTGARIRAEIKAGDTVRVVTADGATHRLLVSAVGESSLAGSAVRVKGATDVAGSRIELPYGDIRQIEVERISGVKTTATALAVALVAAIAIATGFGNHTPGYNR